MKPSFLARATVSALLVSYGMIQNDLITMAAAFLFTPFLAQVMAAGFGLITREWRLALQGGIALGVSTVITVVAGVVVASLTGGPLQYDNFSPLLVNFLISLVVGVVSALSTADAAGRRELIGMAAAAQFAVYPAWFGIMLVLGLPDPSLVGQRWLTFLVNILTILAVSVGIYLSVRYGGDVLKRYSEKV